MAQSIAIIVLLGLLVNWIFEKMKLPGLLGMIILGILMGPHVFNIVSPDLLNISGDLRKIALIVILLRAGLGITKEELRKIGVPAAKLSCIPGILEGFTIAFVAWKLLKIPFIEAGMLGFILAAVSPAVVVPQMIGFIERRKGMKKGIPILILAGASIDDVFAITIFSTFAGFYGGKSVNVALKIFNIPLSIILGIILGVITGLFLLRLFTKNNINDTKKTLIVLAFSILMVSLEAILKGKVEIASLLGVMALGYIINNKDARLGDTLSRCFSFIWIFAQILLFVLVGAEVNIAVALKAGAIGILIIALGLVGRSIGVWISLMGTNLTLKEKVFCVIAYTPKATVQAAMGAVPLSMGVPSGDVILAIAVLSILITAPLGAIGIKAAGERFLEQEEENMGDEKELKEKRVI